MRLQTSTTYNEIGEAVWTQSFNVFEVKDMGNGIARGKLSFGRLPFEKSKADQALITAGIKLDNQGYMRTSIFASFRGEAAKKALDLKDGAVIVDVKFDVDYYPYVNKQGEITYRKEPQWMVIDFTIRESNSNNTSAQVAPKPQPSQEVNKVEEPVATESVEAEEDYPY